MHSADYAVARCMFVRLSVRPFVTLRYSVETATHIKVFLPSGKQTCLIYPTKRDGNTQAETSKRGRRMQGVMKTSRFSTNISLYLGNDARYSHSYYGMWIGTRIWSIKRCHFQWPWTNPNPVFMVTPFYDAKYLTNCYRCGHSYYGRRIGNRIHAFKWYHFQWSWVTLNLDFKVTGLLLMPSTYCMRNWRAICLR